MRIKFQGERLWQEDGTKIVNKRVINTGFGQAGENLRTGLGHPPLELFKSPPRRAPIGKGERISLR